MKVALIQLNSQDSVIQNLQSIWSLLQGLENPREIDLILFPENALYFRINRKEVFAGVDLADPLFDRFYSFAQENDLALVWGGIALKEKGQVTNALVAQTPQMRAEVLYRKIHLFDVTLPNGTEIKESEQFVAGSEPAVWDYKGWKLGLSICYDLRFSELYRFYAQEGVDALLVPAAFTQITGEAHWEALLRARAIESQAYVLAAAQTGDHGSLQTYGHSLAIDPWGQVIAKKPLGCGAVLVDLDKESIHKVRARIPMSSHRKL